MKRLPAPPLPSWLEARLPFDRRCRIEVLGQRIHVMEMGSGRPVLLLHGNPTWGFLYRKVATALEGTDLHLVVPDLLGLGFSDHPVDPGVHTLANHAAWIRGLVDAMGLDNLIVVGQDWGGPIGLRAMADMPARATGLVLMNTVVGPPKKGFKPTAFHRFARLPGVSDLAFRLLGFPQRILGLAQGDRASIRGEVARAYRLPLSSLAENVAPLALARMVPDGPAHPAVPDLEKVAAFVEGFEGPAALVWGTRDPILGRLWKRTSRVLPGASLTLTGAGHFLQEEVPYVIAAAIREVAGAVTAPGGRSSRTSGR